MEENEKENKEDKKDKKKEDKKTNNVVVIIMGLIICLLVGFIAYDKLMVKDTLTEKETTKKEKNAKKEENTEKEKKEEKQEEKAKKLYEADVSGYFKGFKELLSDYGNKGPLKISDISNEDIIEFAYWATDSEERNATGVSNKIEELFGKDFSYTLGDVKCFAGDGILFKYNAADGTFSYYGEHPHGGPGGLREEIYFIDAEEKNDTITIKTKVLYGNSCSDTCGPVDLFFKNATYNENEAIYRATNENEYGNYDVVYKKFKDQLPITTFIMKKQSDGRYGLSEIKLD